MQSTKTLETHKFVNIFLGPSGIKSNQTSFFRNTFFLIHMSLLLFDEIFYFVGIYLFFT